jgi:DNA polymerase-1
LWFISELKKLIPRFGKGSIIIAHNIPFDMKVLNKYGVSWYNAEWIDTMVMSHLLDENEEHGLKYLANKYLGVEVKSFSEITTNTDSDEFVTYAMNDAEWTWSLAQLFKPQLIEQGLLTLFRKIEMPFQRVLVDMELTGVLIDKEKVDDTTKKLQRNLIDLEIQMLDILGKHYEYQYDLFGNFVLKSDINLNSSAQLSIILKDLGIEITEKTESGKDSMGKRTMQNLKGKHAFIDLLDKYKMYQKLLNAFFEPLPSFIDPDGRVRSSFRDIGAKTGRLSCNNPNLQQLPKTKDDEFSVRACFIASPGYKMITCDYSGQELRVLAQVTNDKGLIDAFNSGKDFHSETAAKFGVDRTKAKAINFGIAYGKSAVGFSKDWKCSEQEAQSYLDKYFEEFPGVRQGIDDTRLEVIKQGYVTSLAGRRRRFIKMKDEQGNEFYTRAMYRQAFNFKIQGFSADMIRIAGIKLLNLKYRNKEWGLRILATIHDEYLLEVKEEYTNIASLAIKQAMESTVRLKVPVVSEIGIGDSYATAK